MAESTFRSYNSPGGSMQFGVQYILDTASGVFRPAYDTDFSISANISGVTVDVGTLEGLTTTGNLYLAAISGYTRFLQTGSLATTSANPVGVTGTKLDTASGYSGNNFVMVGGVARAISGFGPTYSSGGNAALNLDNTNGGALVVQSDLNYTVDSIVAYPPQFTTVSQSVPSGGSATMITGIALGNNPVRNEFFIQVVGSGSPLFVAFNSSAAGTGNFNVLLKPASTMYGADGGVLSNSTYQGPVSISGGPFSQFTVWEA